MKATIFVQTMTLGLLILVTACSPRVAVVQPTAQSIQEAIVTATAPARPTAQSPTPTKAAATATTVPPEATQAAVEQAAATSAPATAGCQDAAQYITDDGLDGTTYSPNTAFTKTWTVKTPAPAPGTTVMWFRRFPATI